MCIRDSVKKLIQTFQNIFKIEELKKRILYTLGLLLIYRFGSFVVIPGINPNALSSLADQVSGTGLLGLLDIFSGGAFANASIFALGVMPYISASIIMQLVGMVIPYFQRMQREGESGRRKMNQWTRYLTIIVLLLQGSAYIANLYHKLPSEAFVLGPDNFLFKVSTIVVLTAGTMFVMWLGEKITDKGLGNGISLIIMVGIIARLPQALLVEFNMRWAEAVGGMVMLVVEIVILYLVFMATISVLQAVRKVPVQYAKRIVGRKQYGGQNTYMPIKVNMSGVLPIIFASTFLAIPGTIVGFVDPNAEGGFAKFISNVFSTNSIWYAILYFILIILFNYFYIAIQYNPIEMANNIRKNNGAIPGIRPGKPTSDFISRIISKTTLTGALMLAVIAILPIILGAVANMNISMGGTSIIIVVGVALDTARSLESQMMMRHYKGFLE